MSTDINLTSGNLLSGGLSLPSDLVRLCGGARRARGGWGGVGWGGKGWVLQAQLPCNCRHPAGSWLGWPRRSLTDPPPPPPPWPPARPQNIPSDMKLDSEELLQHVPLPHEATASRSTHWL
jgi:hypothetical protein